MSTTTATAAAPAAPAATVTVLLRTCRAEWGRIWTIRSSWVFALAISVVVLGLGTILGFDARSGFEDVPDGGSWAGGQIAGTFGMFLLFAFALAVTTADHGTGGIVPTLQWTPRRGVLLAARTAVVVLTASGLGLLLVVVASLLVRVIAPGFGLPAGEGLRILGEVALVYVAGTLLAVGLGLVLRNTAAGLMAVIGLVLVLPLMLALIGQAYQWARDLGELVPGTGALHLMFDQTLGSPAPQMTTTYAWVLLGCWAGGALLVGGWRLLRADADR